VAASRVSAIVTGLLACALLAGCGGTAANAAWRSPAAATSQPPSGEPSAATSPSAASPSPSVSNLVSVNGNPNGHAPVPAEAAAVDTSHPTHVIGTGTAASCTSSAVVSTVALGGIMTFNCGPAPATIVLTQTAKIFNASSAQIVIDGGGKVTLSGGGVRRILYMNTCDKAQGWLTSHCQDQDRPSLTVQNLTFADGNSTGDMTEGGGGGAIFVRGGRFKVVNSRFIRNRCDATGPDLGGAAIRVLSQYHNLPVYIVDSTFGGAAGLGGVTACCPTTPRSATAPTPPGPVPLAAAAVAPSTTTATR
jgi:hypothetical protein